MPMSMESFLSWRVRPALDQLTPPKILNYRHRVLAENLKALPGKGFGAFGRINNRAQGTILDRSG